MKKRALTLIEIMIVIFLITLITGTIGYSMRGTLDKGRAFRTEQAKEQLHDLLLICLAEGLDPDEVASKPAESLKRLALAKDPDKLVVDGWKEKFEITLISNKNDFSVKSKALDNYLKRTIKKTDKGEAPEED
jgi:hypothetical protein